MSANLEGIMADLIKVFNRYSGKDGDKYKLSKEELKNMLQKEFPLLFVDLNDTSEVGELLNELDENKDGELDFKEFVSMVTDLTVLCHEFFVD